MISSSSIAPYLMGIKLSLVISKNASGFVWVIRWSINVNLFRPSEQVKKLNLITADKE